MLLQISLSLDSQKTAGCNWASAFNLLSSDVLVGVDEENPVLYSHVVGKERRILIVFIDNCGHSALL